ncbi:hypothetical protein ACP3VQ_24885 [Metapseudomonas otitidis]|uniref:hypothetical protein n=1 Tax=Metapseudomonas otitidis TaxID=319939 RepID=UPI003CE9E395
MDIRFALGSALFVMASLSFAATPKYDSMQADGDRYQLNWQERNGEIVYDTVCGANRKGSVQYRNCRRNAQVIFRDRCNQSDDKSSKWCLAKSRYYP